MEGNPKVISIWIKSTSNCGANTSGHMGYKSCASIEGATSGKMKDQIHKDFHPELGCSGDLNLTGTLHSVNVGTSYSGLWTVLAATDIGYEGREIRSSLSQIGSGTWRRGQARCYSKEIGKSEVITEIVRELYTVISHVIALLCMMNDNWGGVVCAERCMYSFDVREMETR